MPTRLPLPSSVACARLRSVSLAVSLAASAPLGAVGCAAFASGPHTRDGALYASGNGAYDAYFREVHGYRGARQRWTEARDRARGPLAGELHSSTDAADATLAQLTHEGAGAASEVRDAVLVAVESTSQAELERARQLRKEADQVSTLLRTGRELELHVKEAFAAEGGSKPREVQEELRASYDVLVGLSAFAEGQAKGAEDFVLDLQRAVAAATPPKPARGKTPPAAKVPQAAAAKSVAPAPSGSTPPKPTEPVEVFRP